MLYFHDVHGSGIELSSDKTEAFRTKGFCHGITFSGTTVSPSAKICLELGEQAANWSGNVRVGFTFVNPETLAGEELPRFAVPDLTNRPGFWARAVQGTSEKGCRILFHYDTDGRIHVCVNNEYKGVLLTGIDTNNDLWAIVDVYGQTISVKFVAADETPLEILARGPDSMRAFQQASSHGTLPVFRSRLMIVGQDRAGKTTLKKSLTGQKCDTNESSTDGIESQTACNISIQQSKCWTLSKNIPWSIHTTQSTKVNNSTSQSSLPETDDNNDTTTADDNLLQSKEDEYIQAISINIVKELLGKSLNAEKGHIDSSESEKSITESGDTESKSSNRQMEENSHNHQSNYIDKTELVSQPLLEGMPENVVSLVSEMLQEANGRNTEWLAQHTEKTNDQLTLNIWDFAGQHIYYTTHQVFLTSRAIYILVFDMTKDLEAPAVTQVRRSDSNVEWEESEFTNLEFFDFWLNSIHAHAAQNKRSSPDGTSLSPPVFVVGTHRDSLGDNNEERTKLVEAKLNRLRLYFIGKPYQGHITNKYYAIENFSEDNEDPKLIELREDIGKVSGHEPYMGEQMPIKWLKFEQAITSRVQEGINHLPLDTVSQMALDLGIDNQDGLITMLNFYHDLGAIVYYGGCGSIDVNLRNVVILNPQWLIDVFKLVITIRDIDEQWSQYLDSWQKLDNYGILEERLINHMWREILDQKPTLISLMTKFDLLCERSSHKLSIDNTERQSRTFYVPSRLRPCPEIKQLTAAGPNDITIYLIFHGFLPDGLFHRLLARSVRWSQEEGGKEPTLYHRWARFYIDDEHDMILHMSSSRLARVKLMVLREAVFDDDMDEDETSTEKDKQTLPAPKPEIVAKVRNFLDTTLSDLRELWMKRVKYVTSVVCPCTFKCLKHDTVRCSEAECLHFLNLDECLANKVVLCEHRRVKTAHIRKWFPEPIKPDLPAPVTITPETKVEDLPLWLKAAAKLLNCSSDGSDWCELGKRLGYRLGRLEQIGDDINPGSTLLIDWILKSGNQKVSIEMLISYLQQMHREDIVDIIENAQDASSIPPVFISYQWDIQDEVKVLRERLEKSGFSCWMDIGQMGGGDLLYERLDRAIRECKVIISCMTPKYITSSNCNKEITLADLVMKPIVPVMFRKVPWPPPGGMSLAFSQLVYLDLIGVGGHGGSGKHRDLERKYLEVSQQVKRYVEPDCLKMAVDFTKAPDGYRETSTEHRISPTTLSLATSGPQLTQSESRIHGSLDDSSQAELEEQPQQQPEVREVSMCTSKCVCQIL